MRTAFLETLEALAAGDPRICLVVGDLGFTVVEPFARRFPNQFLNAGVAEQNMTGVAVGMALSGKIVFTYSIANFPTLRCIEQIRNDACYHRANLKIVSVGGGYAYGSLGSSHHATEDIAVLRSLPEMVVAAPGDPFEVEQLTRRIVEHDGPCYLRLGKAGEPRVHDGPVELTLGRALMLRDGGDLTLIATGGMLCTARDASLALERHGLSARVLSMHTVKPLDREAILRAAGETGAILTIEEHSELGGLGGAVAEVLAQDAPGAVPFRILGLPDRFCREVGSQGFLRGAAGLTDEGVVEAAMQLLRGRRSVRRETEVSGFEKQSLP